jgi:V8-like Glu-specific endopeptidase
MSQTKHSCLLGVALVLAGCGGNDTQGDWASQLGEPSICGPTVDWQNVEMYNGTLGPSIAFVNAHQGPVGQMFPIGCTGTLIASNSFITAGHCVDSSTVGGQQIRFNFQLDPSGNPRPTSVFNITAVLEEGLTTLGVDYAILQLSGSPGTTFGVTLPTAFAQPAGQAITIIQHPNGIPKVVEGGTLGFFANGKMTYADLDTEGGASGSGILQNTTGALIGVHTTGALDDACDPGDPNNGEDLRVVYGVSPIIRQMALDPAKVVSVL